MLARILCWVSKSFYLQHWHYIRFHVSKMSSAWSWCTFGYSDLMNIHSPLLEELWKELHVHMKRTINVNENCYFLLRFSFSLHSCSLCHPAWHKPSLCVWNCLERIEATLPLTEEHPGPCCTCLTKKTQPKNCNVCNSKGRNKITIWMTKRWFYK